MTDYNAAAEAARSLANQFRAMLIVGDALSGFANFQNQQAELEAAKKTAEDQLNAVKADLERESARLSETQTAITNNVVEASGILYTANANAKKVVADASHEAQEIRAAAAAAERDARDSIDALKADYQAMKSEAETIKAAYNSEIEELKAALNALRSRLNV